MTCFHLVPGSRAFIVGTMTAVRPFYPLPVAKLGRHCRWGAVAVAMLAPVMGLGADASGPAEEVQVLPKFVVPAAPVEEFCLTVPFNPDERWLRFTSMNLRPELEGSTVCRFTFPTGAGVKDRDHIVSINGRAVEAMKRAEATPLLRPTPGTVVALELLPAGEKKTRRVELVLRSYTPQRPGHPARVAYGPFVAAGASSETK